MGAVELARNITEELLKVFGDKLVSAAIFGSAARGKIRSPGSDLDVLLVVDSVRGLGLDAQARSSIHAIDRVIDMYGIRPRPDLDLHTLTTDMVKQHPPILLDMTENVVIGYDKDDFLKAVLHRLREKLTEMGARRVVLPDGSWYWMLKPDIKFGEVVEI